MTIPKPRGHGRLAEKLTEKVAGCSGMFNVQEVCHIEQLPIVLTYKKQRLCLVLEFRVVILQISVSNIVLFRG